LAAALFERDFSLDSSSLL